MKILETAENITVSLLEQLRLAWWLEVVTNNPYCTYYFGLFITESAAKVCQFGYIEDIAQEGAEISSVEVKRFQPKVLTVINDQ